MKLKFSANEEGIHAFALKKKFSLTFPKKIWKAYLDKAFLLDNYSHLSTVCLPLIAKKKRIEYNTSLPLFKDKFKDVVLGDIPCSTHDYKRSTKKTIQEFKNIKYKFADDVIKVPFTKINSEDRAVVLLSCGKDSLLTLGVAKEVDLNPIGLYVNDTVSPSENKTKKLFIKKISKQETVTFIPFSPTPALSRSIPIPGNVNFLLLYSTKYHPDISGLPIWPWAGPGSGNFRIPPLKPREFHRHNQR